MIMVYTVSSDTEAIEVLDSVANYYELSEGCSPYSIRIRNEIARLHNRVFPNDDNDDNDNLESFVNN